jgi:hypothetical protein
MGPKLAAQIGDGAVDEAADVLSHQAAPMRDISSTKAERRGMVETTRGGSRRKEWWQAQATAAMSSRSSAM